MVRLFRQAIKGLPAAAGFGRIVLAGIVNAKVTITRGKGHISADKVVEAADASQAEVVFKEMELNVETIDSTLRLSEIRQSTVGRQAFLEIRIPIAGAEPELICNATAIELATSAPLSSLNCKSKAGDVTVSDAVQYSSLVLDAGSMALHGTLGPGSHFIELRAGKLSFKESIQKSLNWRLQTRLGEIVNQNTNTGLTNPYVGSVGAGAGRLSAQVEVGDIGVN